MLKLIIIFLLIPSIPLLLIRKREVDSHGNPTLRSWGTSVVSTGAGIFFLWKSIEAKLDTALPSCSDDATVLFILSVIFLLGGLGFFYFRTTLFNDHIEQKFLPCWTVRYPLNQMTSIEKVNKKAVILLFSNGKKISISDNVYSGRVFFLEKLEKLWSKDSNQLAV